jgi:hypothetical protein
MSSITQTESPKTQSLDAIKALLKFVGRGCDPLPVYVELTGGVRLTKSSKGDAYYTTTPTDCSCKARAFNPGHACKHMKALIAGNAVEVSRSQARAYQARQRELKGSMQPGESIRPEGKWAGGYNGPVDLLSSEERRAAKA